MNNITLIMDEKFWQENNSKLQKKKWSKYLLVFGVVFHHKNRPHTWPNITSLMFCFWNLSTLHVCNPPPPVEKVTRENDGKIG